MTEELDLYAEIDALQGRVAELEEIAVTHSAALEVIAALFEKLKEHLR